MSKDETLKVPVIRVNKPCEECGSTNYPNLQYSLVGITGVLCRACLQTEIDNVNRALDTTNNAGESEANQL